MKLPTSKEIEALHRKYAVNDEVFDLVFTHCKIVHEIATQLVDGTDTEIDMDLESQ